MARRRPGLGKSLNDILAEEGRIDANRDLTQLIPQDIPDQADDQPLSEFNMYGEPRRPSPTVEVETLGIGGVDYDTYYVEDARPPEDNYGQGPDRSTRVAAHKFVPLNPEQQKGGLGVRAGLRGGQEVLGTVYVKFQKKGNTYKYTYVPESVYKRFSESTSKGRFINQFLNSYSPRPIGTRNDREQTGDFY